MPLRNGWMEMDSAPKNHLPVLIYGKHGAVTAFRDVAWVWWPIPAKKKLKYIPECWQHLPGHPHAPT